MLAEGERFVPVVRDAAKWAALGLPGTPRIAEVSDPAALRLALQGAETIISTAHARYFSRRASRCALCADGLNPPLFALGGCAW
jgi:hypothetical protein